MAIFDGKQEIVIFLIDNGADVNMVEGQNFPPITIAIYREYIDILENLIEKGGNLDATINSSSNWT